MMGDLTGLLDDARAEAKRRGHGSVVPAHLAIVLHERHPQALTSILPAAEAALARLPVTYDSPDLRADVVALEPLLKSGDIDAVAAALSHAISESTPEPMEGTAFAIPEALSDSVRIVPPDDSIVGRSATVDAILDHLDRKQSTPVLLVGEEGSGRTAIASALAGSLATRGIPVVRIDNARTPGERQLAALTEMLRLAPGNAVIFVDDIEIALGLGFAGGVAGAYIAALRPVFEQEGQRIVVVIPTDYLPRLQGTDRELVDEFARVKLPPLPDDILRSIIDARAADIGAFHGVAMDAATIDAALAPAQDGDLGTHPALAIRRLDIAATRAARHSRAATPEDVPVIRPTERRVDPKALALALREQIVGQDAAIDTVAGRLAVTVAQLDLNPHRPDGVFLFAGPTGVGKTALALAMARALFGSDGSLVRIDMSELHSEHTVAKLVGSPPGYVGHDDPSGWLTTQIRSTPRCVLLLDEIEKADSQVWNTFLQVFDAGRLTDLRGATADFREVVIVMTTNLGAETFSDKGAIGFVDNPGSAAADTSTVREILRRTMRPELLNRIDEILVFTPLSPEAVTEIARMRTADALAVLRERGYQVEASQDLLDLIARIGFSREYGAREMLRTVERLVLQPLAALPAGAYRAIVTGDSATWQAA
jgi:ATP-dependent Clp protease ATP-binding subunit ClpA